MDRVVLKQCCYVLRITQNVLLPTPKIALWHNISASHSQNLAGMFYTTLYNYLARQFGLLFSHLDSFVNLWNIILEGISKFVALNV